MLVEVGTGVFVGEPPGELGVDVAVAVTVAVGVSVGVLVLVGVLLGDVSGVVVTPGVAVSVGVAVGVAVSVGVLVGVAVSVGVLVGVAVSAGVFVGVAVGVGVVVGTQNTSQSLPAPSVPTFAPFSNTSNDKSTWASRVPFACAGHWDTGGRITIMVMSWPVTVGILNGLLNVFPLNWIEFWIGTRPLSVTNWALTKPLIDWSGATPVMVMVSCSGELEQSEWDEGVFNWGSCVLATSEPASVTGSANAVCAPRHRSRVAKHSAAPRNATTAAAMRSLAPLCTCCLSLRGATLPAAASQKPAYHLRRASDAGWGINQITDFKTRDVGQGSLDAGQPGSIASGLAVNLVCWRCANPHFGGANPRLGGTRIHTLAVHESALRRSSTS